MAARNRSPVKASRLGRTASRLVTVLGSARCCLDSAAGEATGLSSTCTALTPAIFCKSGALQPSHDASFPLAGRQEDFHQTGPMERPLIEARREVRRIALEGGSERFIRGRVVAALPVDAPDSVVCGGQPP